ncbi:MAG TPA: hypothetical protein DCP92_24525 [Nitrospiraceae bacterium]|jgi:plasmid stability protein|nr:hypothetical protein [Nitrospiraceae bacterium]
MTIRGFDDLTIKALKEKARQEGKSVNTTFLKLLKEDLGLKKKRRSALYNGSRPLGRNMRRCRLQRVSEKHRGF